MLYSINLGDKKINNYGKLKYLLNIKGYFVYIIVAFLLSRINVLFYMAPIGIAFTMVCMFKNDKFFNVLICLSSIIGYFSVKEDFVVFDLYIIINIILFFISFVNLNKFRNFLFAISVFGSIYLYKSVHSGFSITFSLISAFIEVCLVFILSAIFRNFLKVINYFKTNEIFTREEMICLVITICLSIVGFNNIRIFNFDISNILLCTFVFIMSYINGISIGMIVAVFSGLIMGIVCGDFSKYIAIYSLISFVSSILYLSSRFLIVMVSFIATLIVNISSIPFLDLGENIFFIEIFISMIIFLLIPNKILNKSLIYFNEEYKKEFYTQKRLFNTLDMRIQKINNFNDIIKQLSEMIISSNGSVYKNINKKIYIEIIGESVCSGCNKVNLCWKRNFKSFNDKLLLSFDNFTDGNNKLEEYIENICLRKELMKRELLKVANFYNMKEMYENKIYEAQDLLSYELKNVYNIVDQGMKEVKKDIIVKVNYEKSLISKFNKFGIKYCDLICYEKNDKTRVKIIVPYDTYCGYKVDILEIINLALNKNMVLQEESIQYVNFKKEVVLGYVEHYDYNIISCCSQLSKYDKSGDNYVFDRNDNDDYVIILSDGIGSGKEAHIKSKFIVELILKFIKTDLSLSVCIKELISIISLKFFRDETVSSIDFASINLYTGKMDYLKFSSVFSYVKRGNDVFILDSFEEIEEELSKETKDILVGEFKLEYGDILIHLTDGLVYFNDLSNRSWLYKFLKETDTHLPDKLCEEIINEFKILSGDNYQDDVSVIVSKVYKNPN